MSNKYEIRMAAPRVLADVIKIRNEKGAVEYHYRIIDGPVGIEKSLAKTIDAVIELTGAEAKHVYVAKTGDGKYRAAASDKPMSLENWRNLDDEGYRINALNGQPLSIENWKR